MEIIIYYENLNLIQTLTFIIAINSYFKDNLNNSPSSNNYFSYFLITFIKVILNNINAIIKNLLVTKITVIDYFIVNLRY